jgi:hypothetical protein
MRVTILIPFLFAVQGVVAQVNVVHLKEKSIPEDMKFKGGFDDAVQYTDKQGTHVVITTEDEGTKIDDGDTLRTACLYAFSYLKTAGGAKLSWQLYDFADPCEFDIEARYKPGSPAVTDLDKNGIAEVWLTYFAACKSDVSPSDMKIIMHQGDKKIRRKGRNPRKS